MLATGADRLKQFSLIGMVGLYAPGSSVELLKLNLFMQVPMLLFTPLIGALLDRWSKAGAIVIACFFRAALVVAVPALFNWTHSPYSLYMAAFVLSLADLTFGPARAAILPEIAAQERLLRLNAVFWTLSIVATLGGLLFGGWLFDFRSWESTFYVDSAVYVAAAIAMIPVLFLHAGHRSTDEPLVKHRDPGHTVRAVHKAIADGVRLIRADRYIAVSLLTQSSLFAVGGALSVIAVARVQEVAQVERAFFLAQVGAALLFGLVIGAGISGFARSRARADHVISVSALLAGVAIAGVGRTETIIPMSIWAALLGASMSPPFVITETVIQRNTPREFLGRVFAAREALIKAAFLAAAVLATVANQFYSKPSILVALGLFLALLGVVLERTRWLKAQPTD